MLLSGTLTAGLVWGGAHDAVAALWVHPYIYSIFAAILSFILVFRAQVGQLAGGGGLNAISAAAGTACAARWSPAHGPHRHTACSAVVALAIPCAPQYGYNRYWEARTQLQVMSMRLTDAAAQVGRSWRPWHSEAAKPSCIARPPVLYTALNTVHHQLPLNTLLPTRPANPPNPRSWCLTATPCRPTTRTRWRLPATLAPWCCTCAACCTPPAARASGATPTWAT